MSYVMVPVPEEIKDQVVATLGQIAFRDALANWAPDALRTFMAETSEAERSLIGELVESALEKTSRTRLRLVESQQVSAEDLDELIINLNRRASDAGNPWLIMVSRGEEGDGTPRTESVYLSTKVATLIDEMDLLNSASG